MLNKKITLYLIPALLLFSIIQVFAQVGSTPEILGVSPSISNNEGQISIGYSDRTYGASLEAVKLVIGNKNKNKHVLSIEFFAIKNEVSIRIDNGEWETAPLAYDSFSNEFFTIYPQGIVHTWKKMYGLIVLPISFDAEAILGKPGRESYDIYASVTDVDGNKTELKKHSAFQLEFVPDGLMNAAYLDTLIGSSFKWIGWSGKIVDVHLVLTNTDEPERPHQLMDDDDTLFFVDGDRVFDIKKYDYLEISNVRVVYRKEGGYYKQFINFRLTYKGGIDLDKLLGPTIHLYQFNRKRADVHLYCLLNRYFIPTWWVPVIAYWSEMLY